MRAFSIKQKLMLITMSSSAVALLLITAAFLTYEWFSVRRSMAQDLSTLAEIIGSQSTGAITFGYGRDAEEILKALSAKKHVEAAAIYKGDDLLASYCAPGRVPAEVVPAHPGPDGTRFNGDHLVLCRPIEMSGATVGAIYLRSNLDELHARLWSYTLTVLIFMVASLAATYLLAARLQRIISRPISHLAQTAKIVSVDRNYAVRARRESGDELGQLIDGFNEMLAQIQERDTALREANDQLEKRVHERTQDLREEIVERQRAEAGLQQQFMRISLLNQITQAISERQDTESILHVVLRQLEDHLNLDLGLVALHDPQADSLNVAAVRVKNPLLISKLDLHEGTVLGLADSGLQLCREGQTVYWADTLKGASVVTEKLTGAGVRSAATVPLMVENRLFGVLVAARLKIDSFSSGDCEFLRLLSEHVALAAHQANLHSELENAYNELRQTQQTVMQQERLKALGQMASGVAHDINNALSPIVGFADLLVQGEKDLSENGKKYLKYIRTSGEDIAHIVTRLREFYRRRDEKEDLQRLNLNTLAEQVVDMTRPRWRDIPQSRGLTIVVGLDLAADAPEFIGIESEVREALTNLVLNAVDALPHGGKIAIRTRVNRRAAGPNGQASPTEIAVEVSDTGVGMDEETRKRCLEPFFSTKGKRGTGLGLAMVYGVMQRHDGEIEIQSESGKGTTIRLVFPVSDTAEAASETESNTAKPPPLQILCIDDEPLLRELIKEILERDGHAVEVSDNGQSGLDIFRLAQRRGQPFDVVITDLGMPFVDGRQVARALKRESPATPVVMLTGWGTLMKEEGSVPAQVDGVLSKPPRSKELRETLCRLASARHRSRG